MTEPNTGAQVIPHPTLLRPFQISPEVRRVLRATQYPPAESPDDSRRLTDEEFAHFITVCEARRMDPLKRHIYATKRWNSYQGRHVLSVEATIDGLRLTADRTKRYRGQTKTLWAGADGRWFDAWLKDEKPAAAMVGIWREGDIEPITAVAHLREFEQSYGVWPDKPRLMLAKCAEALALRKAFPEELGGLYTAEELGRDDATAPSTVVSDPRPAASAALAGVQQLLEACAEIGYSVAAAHCLAHLSGGADQIQSLTLEQSARAIRWARTLADAEVPEQALKQATAWALNNTADAAAAQAKFETWVAKKQRGEPKALPAAPATPTAPPPPTPSAEPIGQVPLQAVIS